MKYTDPDGRLDKESIHGFVHAVGANPLSVSLAQNGIFPNPLVGFSFDKSQGLYHATFNCWQGSMFGGLLGYNKLYDIAFDLGTSMKADRFDFSSGGTDYTLWAWKGDYLNMGAGCEIGIYQKGDGFLGKMDHFVVNKDLAMDMSVTLTMGDSVIGSFSGNHWWGTSFNPSVQNAKAEDMTAQFSIKFNDSTMYNDFKSKWGDNQKWFFDDSSNCATLTF